MSRLLDPQGPLRRLARRMGLGRLLQRSGLADLWRERAARRRGPVRPPTDPAGKGAVLVGHPYGVQAVGEYLRASAAALAAAGVPFHIRNTPDWGQHLKPVHGGFAFWDRLRRDSPYAVNLIHVNADEMAATRRDLGADFARRFNVACWHWELSRFPQAWRSAFTGVDELWAPSRFLREALAAAARVPVEWMPHPVEVAGAAAPDRAAFGLPQGLFLFLASFDLGSYAARKNPLGAVRAFRRAFPPESAEAVGLVVKVSGAGEHPAQAEAFRMAPELQDPRVVIVDALLERGRMLGLLASCDCYVSLHRAEGFGRVLAEALLLERPVVATGYSGNMDFTTPLTAGLVDHVLVPVPAGAYPHAEGQVWADPDLDHAAWWMRRLVAEPELGRGLAARGRELVSAQHGVQAVGRRYRARLEELGFLQPLAATSRSW